MSHDKCGTYAGYNQHMRAYEKPCEPCQQAATDYLREYRKDPKAQMVNRRRTEARRRAHQVLARLYPAAYNKAYVEALADISEEPKFALPQEPSKDPG